MQLPDIIATSLGWLAYEFSKMQPFIPTYTHLILSALFPIFTGAHASLSRPSSAAKPVKSRHKDGLEADEEDEEEEVVKMEGLSPTDALMFPILAGTTLAGLYFLLKWLQDPTLLNKILNWYFATFSVFAVSRLVSDGLDVLHSFLFPHDYLDRGILFHVDPKTRKALPANGHAQDARSSPLPWVFSRLPLPQFLLSLFWKLHVLPSQKLTFEMLVKYTLYFKLGLGIHGIEGLCAGLASVLYYNFVSKPWWLTNLMGFGFAYSSLQVLSPTTFWTGTLILSGLFFYDIYFVFFTPMMVTVAKSLDIPIKLLFPRPSEPDADPAHIALSMLGLGDVVLPGIMIGLALRFDLYMFYLRKQSKVTDDSDSVANVNSTAASPQTPSETAEKDEVTNGSTSADETIPVPAKEQSITIKKAKYTSVAEGWGDRLWTFSSFPMAAQSYTPRGVFPKPYFNASMSGYVVGMLATLAAMQISDHAQPALLYLVPGVLSSLWSTAYLRGEFHEFWNFSDAGEDEIEDKARAKSSKGDDLDKKDEQTGEKKKGMSSFFGFKRNEERSQRVEAAMGKHGSKSDSKETASENHKSGKKARQEDDEKISGSTLFSFSITAPPPLAKQHADRTERSGNLTSDDKKSDEASSTSHDESARSTEDDAAKEGVKELPRWSTGPAGRKVEEHTGKRQRLD